MKHAPHLMEVHAQSHALNGEAYCLIIMNLQGCSVLVHGQYSVVS